MNHTVLLMLAALLLVWTPWSCEGRSAGNSDGNADFSVVSALCARVADHPYCNSLKRSKRSAGSTDILSEIPQIQLPGTKWCGAGSTAEDEHDLGLAEATDRCCRTHDHCPEFLTPGQSRDGVTNVASYTVSSCECDVQFFTCLERASTPHAQVAGELYFNILKPKCLVRGCRSGRTAGCPEARGRGLVTAGLALADSPVAGEFPEDREAGLLQRADQLALRTLDLLMRQRAANSG